MPSHYEVAIIGAGPGGLGAATNAAVRKISHVLIERREIGNTVFDYQKRKLVMAEPAKLPLRGHVKFAQGSREEILDGWNAAVKATGVNVLRAEVSSIKKNGELFEIGGKEVLCTAKYIVLAIGLQGTPRKLGVPGEDLSHVAYTLADPDEFTGKNILVVGAGDAAIENALALAEKNAVSILNRTAEFARAKEANAAKILDAINAKRIKMFANSEMGRVEQGFAYINTQEGECKVPCDQIIARLGCNLPRKQLEGYGIKFPNPDPASVPIVNHRYESNVPGLFIVGALIGYPLIKQAMNQGFEVVEHICGNPVEPADQVLIDERLAHLKGKSADNLAIIRKALPLFSDLSDSQFRELIIESTVHQFSPKQKVFERNDYSDTFFSVVSGAASIELPSGGTISITPGNYFGEMGLLSGRRRAATVHVAEEGIFLETPRKQMLKLMSSVQSVKDNLDRAFMQRALETSIFPEADPKFLRELVTQCKQKLFKKGEVLFKEGDPGDCLYVIRKGSVKVSRRNSAGIDVAQTYIAAGNPVGEMALLSSETRARSATVTALVPTETIVIAKTDFQGLLSANARVQDRIEKLAREREVQNITSTLSAQAGSILDFVMAQGVTDADNVLLIDSDLCVGCDNCESACAATHGGYSRLDRKGGKSFASIQIPISCRHCENPLCMLDCPPDALTRRPDGEVIIRDSCIGCGNCVRNCPYGVIKMVYAGESGFSLLSMLGLKKKKGPAKAGKCDMCGHLDGGPACVRSCPTGAAMRVNPSKLLTLVTAKRGS